MQENENFAPGFLRQQHDIQVIQARLERYFKRDKEQRFEVERVIGSGEFGLTWKLRYNASGLVVPVGTNVPETSGLLQPSFRYIVLKTEFSQLDKSNEIFDGYYSTFDTEKAMLDALRWAKHISTGLEIPNDPLAQRFPGIPWHRLIRMVIAMSWPPEKPAGENPQPVIEEIRGPARAALVHSDLFLDEGGVGNMMVGDLLPEDPELEHSLAPILYLIDLAEMKNFHGHGATRHAIYCNLREMGSIMILLITLDHRIAMLSSTSTTVKLYTQGRNRFNTYAHDLVGDIGQSHPFPWIDPTLRTLICICHIVQIDKQPSAQAILDAIKTCKSRDEQYYANQPGYDGVSESDERIKSILSAVLLDA
ncbi:hypothetical protein F4803DRAFT_551868 [Xylaria telfairii]|nr:hypothetical protein F4803DRAFT_551868 [Xylaria telfairii]